MLTEIGKYLRKLRIDHNETLAQMASKLNVTATLLSYVENGKRTIPDKWLNEIPALYHLDQTETLRFQQIGLRTLQTIHTKVESEEDKILALAFARRLSELTNEEKEKLKSVLFTKED